MGVKTNLGKGYVFERIVDFDGRTSDSLEDYLEQEGRFNDNYDLLLKLMCQFKKSFFEDRLITMDLFPENILIKKNSIDDWSGVLINDMGSGAKIPLEYYIDYFRKAKIKRKWDRFTDFIKDNYKYERIAEFYSGIR